MNSHEESSKESRSNLNTYLRIVYSCLLNMINSACACLFSYMLTCLRLTDMTMPFCKMALINMWGIVVQQYGTADISVSPLRHAECRMRGLKQREPVTGGVYGGKGFFYSR